MPCTVIEVGPCVVTQIKCVEKDGYDAVQLGFQEAKEKNTSKPMMGHFAKCTDIPKEKWILAMNKVIHPKFLEMNLKAFELGYAG